MKTKSKKVTVLIGASANITERALEALRMSVGLTLCDDDIRVVFIGDGVDLLKTTGVTGNDAQEKHVQTLIQLKKRLFAHDGSMREKGINDPRYAVELRTTEDIARMVTESDVVISWPP